MDSSHLDRQAVEQLSGVGERRARQLLAGLPGIRAANAGGISRIALSERLEATVRSRVYQCAAAPAWLKSWTGPGARSPHAAGHHCHNGNAQQVPDYRGFTLSMKSGAVYSKQEATECTSPS